MTSVEQCVLPNETLSQSNLSHFISPLKEKARATVNAILSIRSPLGLPGNALSATAGGESVLWRRLAVAVGEGCNPPELVAAAAAAPSSASASSFIPQGATGAIIPRPVLCQFIACHAMRILC